MILLTKICVFQKYRKQKTYNFKSGRLNKTKDEPIFHELNSIIP